MSEIRSKSGENYVLGSTYELFIRCVFQCGRGEHGAEVAYFKNLLDTEEGNNYVRIPVEKQLASILGYLEKAFNKVQTLKLSIEDKEKMNALQGKVMDSDTGREIITQLEKGLKIISKYRKAY